GQGGFSVYKLIALLMLAGSCAFAQRSAAPPTQTGPTVQDPNSTLTPQQQREKQIRIFDPLDPTSPQDDRKKSDQRDAGATAAQSQPQRPASRSVAPTPLPGSVA